MPSIQQVMMTMQNATFVPPSIKQWMETDQLVGFVNNDPVGAWANSGTGGTNYDFSSTLTKRPLYKTGGPNGKPYLNFDGGNDTMAIGSSTVVNDNVGTMIMVLTPNNQLGTFSAAYIGRKFGMYYLIDGASHHWGTYLNGAIASSTALVIGTWYVLGLVVRAANDIDLYTGLTKQTITTGSAYNTKSLAYLASSDDAEQWGFISTVAVGYDDSALGTTTMNTIISGLGTKYSITV